MTDTPIDAEDMFDQRLESPSYKLPTCRNCGQKSLNWKDTAEGWRLFDGSRLHVCTTQPLLEHSAAPAITCPTLEELELYWQQADEAAPAQFGHIPLDNMQPITSKLSSALPEEE